MAGKKSRPPSGHKANLGRKCPESDKIKISKTLMGRKITWKDKISEGNSRVWLITKPNGNKITIKNLEKYCKENNLNSSKMSCVACGARKHHKGHLCQKLGS